MSGRGSLMEDIDVFAINGRKEELTVIKGISWGKFIRPICLT